MPTLRIDASTISSGSFTEDILTWLTVFLIVYVILRLITRNYYKDPVKETTIIHVQTPKVRTCVESPCVSYITININHRGRTMSDIQLPPSCEEAETKKEV